MYIPIGVPRVFENLFFIYILLALLFIFVFSRFFFFFIIRFVSIFTLLCRPRTYIISKSTLWKVYFSINRSLPASFVLFSVCTLVLFCCLRFFFHSFLFLRVRSLPVVYIVVVFVVAVSCILIVYMYLCEMVERCPVVALRTVSSRAREYHCSLCACKRVCKH